METFYLIFSLYWLKKTLFSFKNLVNFFFQQLFSLVYRQKMVVSTSPAFIMDNGAHTLKLGTSDSNTPRLDTIRFLICFSIFFALKGFCFPFFQMVFDYSKSYGLFLSQNVSALIWVDTDVLVRTLATKFILLQKLLCFIYSSIGLVLRLPDDIKI